MKTNKRYKVRPEKIHSLRDIELEKTRLQIEIMKAEESIHDDYRRILESFTLRNLATSLFDDLSMTSGIAAKAFGIGKTLFSRRKKKKLKGKENSSMSQKTDDTRKQDDLAEAAD